MRERLGVHASARAPLDAIVPDGGPAPEPLDPIRVYRPSTAPGHPLPHAWLDADDGRRLSTLDLVRPGRFLLIAGEEDSAWCDAARDVAEKMGVPLDAVSIGHLDGDYLDPRCQWLQRREIAAEGALLVRPDRFVAWRSAGASRTREADLRLALETVLRREPSGKGS